MNTTIYLIRHSEPFKVHRGIERTQEDILSSNIKSPLSVNGENIANNFAQNTEFNNINTVWSSNYVRAMSTAKYLAYYNDTLVNISDSFNERVHGISSWDELPQNFEEKQIKDENYKLSNGESQKEVRERMYKGVFNLLNEYKGEKIAIVSHATAILFLLSKWCTLIYKNKPLELKNNILSGKPDYLETFKLTFDENNNLINITNLKLKEKDNE